VVPSQKLESNDISLGRINTIGGEGQRPALGNLDGDIRSAGASGETQKSGNEGSKTHVSDKVGKRRRKVRVCCS